MDSWKIAFFVLLGVWLVSSGYLLYRNFDNGVTITYMREGYADCEAHRDFFHEQAKGILTKSGMEARAVIVKESTGDYTHEVGFENIEWRFDEDGKYVASRLGASEAGKVDGQ